MTQGPYTWLCLGTQANAMQQRLALLRASMRHTSATHTWTQAAVHLVTEPPAGLPRQSRGNPSPQTSRGDLRTAECKALQRSLPQNLPTAASASTRLGLHSLPSGFLEPPASLWPLPLNIPVLVGSLPLKFHVGRIFPPCEDKILLTRALAINV